MKESGGIKEEERGGSITLQGFGVSFQKVEKLSYTCCDNSATCINTSESERGRENEQENKQKNTNKKIEMKGR